MFYVTCNAWLILVVTIVTRTIILSCALALISSLLINFNAIVFLAMNLELQIFQNMCITYYNYGKIPAKPQHTTLDKLFIGI